jgi:hypothetical protein
MEYPQLIDKEVEAFLSLKLNADLEASKGIIRI